MLERRVNNIEILNFIILFDLFFCGSGRLIMFGSISMRMVLFALAVTYTIGNAIVNGESFEAKSMLAIAFFLTYLVFNVICVGDKSLGIKFDFFSRYAYVAMVFFYETYFSRDNTDELIAKMRSMIEVMTLAFAIFSIVLWIYALSLGQHAYDAIEMNFLRPKVYGNFDFIGGRIPRIFLKGSIFVPIGLLFEADHFLKFPTVRSTIKCGIYVIALATTFTTGLFFATAVCGIILLLHERAFLKKIGLLMGIIIAAMIPLTVKAGLINVMALRYHGDYSTSYRTIQLISSINEFLKKPLFGHGFGYEFTTIYGNTVRTTSGFEIAWGETLVDCGIIGFLGFVFIILLVFYRLLTHSDKDNTLYIFALSLLLICLESLTNPFINNSIGLTFFAICAGIGNSVVKKEPSTMQSCWSIE